MTANSRSIEVEVNIGAGSVAEAVTAAVRAESHGAAQIGVWDSPAGVPDCWTTLGVLSQHVSTVPIGVAVTNPVTRHPVVTARAIASLSEAARGGVFLGMGTGDSGVYNLGRRAATLQNLREYVMCVRALLRDGRARWQDTDLRLKREPGVHVPVYLAAHGLRSLELAAETADGIFIGLGHSEDVVREVLNVVRRGAERANRDPEGIDLVWNAGAISINDDSDRAVTDTGWLVASLSHHFARFNTSSKLIPIEFQEGVRKLGELYDLSQHGHQSTMRRQEYIEAAMDLGVWDYLSDRFLIAGTEAEVRARIETLRSRDVRKFEIGLSVGGPDGVASVLDLVRRINDSDRS
ncbi:LLM class flavin-dependent oxidoreductase [Streptomyces sp. NBC_00882]|uniref:LLM class flavin-dependent oxidoreductase n=1 Tax=Streptomyces TaxID=1883 RepID=UPI00386577D7|nr:LLM class flavin-dependent oxidoreductase [Streptomyces sp. NBC_00882]WSZ63813.1 LLM class flavin-dependent oxidoreductase [Streptomyces canus]